MKPVHRACALALAAILSGVATAQTPAPTPALSAQQQFDAAKALYEKDMGYYADAAIKLREENKRASGGMACSYADLVVVALSSAQVQLKIMIDLITAAHQDVSSWQAAYNDNAEQLTLRNGSFTRSGC